MYFIITYNIERICLSSIYHPYVLSPSAAAVSTSHVTNERDCRIQGDLRVTSEFSLHCYTAFFT